MKKIMIVNQHYYPELASTGQVFQEIAEHFVREGYTVQVVAGMPFYHDQMITDLKMRELNGVQVLRLWNTTFKKSSFVGKVFNLLTFQISLLFYMLSAIDSQSIVLIGTNPPMGIVCGAIAKSCCKFKLIGVIQDLYPDILVSSGMSQETTTGYKVLRRIMKYAFKKCDRVVTISKDMKEYIQRQYEVKEVQEINNMVIGDLYPLDHRAVKEAKGFKDKFIVMYSGNFGVAHEYETLLQAIKLLHSHETILFYIVGGGINYNRLKEKCEEEALSNVVFKAYVAKEELNNSLNIADVHITIFNDSFKNVLMPSKYYGILACQKPIILIADGENDISRDIREYHIGFTVGKGEGQVLAEQLCYMEKHPEELAVLRENAQSLYKSHYAKEVVLKKYSKVVEEV